MPLLFVLLAAVMDETIQSFSLGRSPSVFDVWIDVAGGCTGIALLFLGAKIHTWFQRKEKNNEKDS